MWWNTNGRNKCTQIHNERTCDFFSPSFSVLSFYTHTSPLGKKTLCCRNNNVIFYARTINQNSWECWRCYSLMYYLAMFQGCNHMNISFVFLLFFKPRHMAFIATEKMLQTGMKVGHSPTTKCNLKQNLFFTTGWMKYCKMSLRPKISCCSK